MGDDGASLWKPEVWAPALLVLGAMLSLIWSFPSRPGARWDVARVGCALIGALVALRYAAWRATSLPPDQTPVQQAWTWLFLLVEGANLLTGLLTNGVMSRTIDRSAEADAAAESPLRGAPVDVFIATYNEPREVLERTIVGALAIDHADLRVWVCDDGARPWVEALATELGAGYIRRVEGRHAKAGNINNAVSHALSIGRHPEFILVLDADFVASRHILSRTLGLFGVSDVGMVQTPQHFFNPDPVLLNLHCTDVAPDEQRFFFNALLPCLDAWGVAFCCGTSCVIRLAALTSVGGIATETVTEDMLTSVKLRANGWRTIFLNERLSFGLAPEGLAEFVTQRGRWCLGAIQQLRTPWSPFGRAAIGWRYRVSFFLSILNWVAAAPFRLMILACPAIYWLTGTSVIAATGEDLIIWLAPHALASIVFMLVFSRGYFIPILSDIMQLISARVIIANAAVGLARPWGRGFKITPKGVGRAGVVVQWSLMWPFLGIAAATLLGLTTNATMSSEQFGSAGYPINIVWSVLNAGVLVLACLACVETPQRRSDERFQSGEPAVIAWDGSATECVLRDISISGARVQAARTPDRSLEGGTLLLDGDRVRLPFSVRRRIGEVLAIHFEIGPDDRRSLIRRLYDGFYVRETEERLVHRVWLGLLRTLWA